MENEMTVVNQEQEVMEGTNFVMDLKAPRTQAYCSFVPQSQEEKIKFYNAINSTQQRIGDHVNEVIRAKEIYMEVVVCTNRETGEQTQCPRTVIIDDKGVGYCAVSLGVFGGIKKIFQVFGEPKAWEGVLPLKVKQITKGERKILTFEAAASK